MTTSAPTMYSGDTKKLPFTIALPEGGDLNGSTFRWACARKLSSGFAAPAVSKTLGSGITVTDADAGTLEVRLDPADTGGLSGRFHHELELTDVVGNVSTVATGTLTILRDL